MREVETRLLPITRCAECKYFVREGNNGLCLKVKKEMPLLHWLITFDKDCPLETKAHADMVKRREVFERDCRMQTERWDFITKRPYTEVWPYTKEDLTLKYRVPVGLEMRRTVWSMVRRCNGLE